MTEPLGRGAAVAALEGVDPVAWLSYRRDKKVCIMLTPHISFVKTKKMNQVSKCTQTDMVFKPLKNQASGSGP